MELNSKEELKKFQKKVMPFVAFLKVRLLLLDLYLTVIDVLCNYIKRNKCKRRV